MVADNQQKNTSSLPRTKWERLVAGYALLGGPIAWFTHFNIMYFLVQPVCRLGGDVWFHVVTAVMLIACIGAGVVAWRLFKNSANFDELVNGIGSWRPFVALFGVASAAIFAYAIIYQWTPVVTFGVCDGMRPLS